MQDGRLKRKMIQIFLLFIVSLIVLLPTCWAESQRIQDNSIFIEEASNQDPGVLQIIQTYQYKRSDLWTYALAIEAPMQSKNHQISSVLPVSKVKSPQDVTGIQDATLSYRYQAVDKEELKLAPRIGFVLPTGNSSKGLGSGNLGGEIMLPLSTRFSNNWESHWNLRFTFIPNAKNPEGLSADILSVGYGTGFIFFYRENFNILMEIFGSNDEAVVDSGEKERSSTLFLSPGFRTGFEVSGNSEIVLGLGLPTGIGSSQGEGGVTAYLSFEGPFL